MIRNPRKRKSPGAPSERISVGVVPYRVDADAVRFLLLRAYNYWDFPKGMPESGEKPLETATREFEEETGLSAIEFASAEVFTETEPYSGGKIARYYLGRVEGGEVRLPVNPQLGRPEHHEFRWMTAKEAAPLLVPRIRKVLEWARGRLPD